MTELAADGLPPLRDVIASLGLSARKGLGQNFLLDLNLTGRIARAAGDLSNHTVIEIGPGPGGLTRALLAADAAHVIAVELDPRCIPALEQIAAHWPGRLTIISADALKVDEAALLAIESTRRGKVIANLPYNVATTLLVKWLTPERWPVWFDSLTLMFQREVAERIVAPPGSRTYGRLSVLAQWHCAAKILFDVPPSAFVPRPKIMSSIVQITPREKPLAEATPDALFKVTQTAFGQRRKMLRGSLKPLGDPAALLTAAGVADDRRPETLSIEEFCAIARAWEAAS